MCAKQHNAGAGERTGTDGQHIADAQVKAGFRRRVTVLSDRQIVQAIGILNIGVVHGIYPVEHERRIIVLRGINGPIRRKVPVAAQGDDGGVGVEAGG
ncbi:MAG: hypothetical protein WCV62_01475, partial [Candidatus Peribacteraceae bacterium]